MNKLKDHSTPGPWQQSSYVSKSDHHHLPTSLIDKWSREERDIVRGAGIIGSPECNIVAIVSNEADRKLIIAAPEMRNFIADLLQWHDEQLKVENMEDLYHMPQELVNRAETILKKSYNF